MDLHERLKILTKKSKSIYPAGSVYRVFELYEKEGKDYQGNPITWIKLEPEERKKKKSIN